MARATSKQGARPADGDVIAAVATGAARGGIGVVRISGPDLAELGAAILDRPPRPGRICRREFRAGDGSVIDVGLALSFKAPASFTGEDVLELHGHGGIAVMELLLGRALELGARLAAPGEFSLRAFQNGKLDLAQAEGVADLVNATSARTARLAAASMRGGLGRRVRELERELSRLRGELEAQIDFADEDIAPATGKALAKMIATLGEKLARLEDECASGARLREGASIALVGRPNAGKSSLLNFLCGRDVAITDAAPGTTRDVVSAACELDGMELLLHDTAGLRGGGSAIEREGMSRARAVAAEADLVVLVRAYDDKRPPELEGDLTVLSKIDLADRVPAATAREVPMSARRGLGLEQFVAAIGRLREVAGSEPAFLARTRHVAALAAAGAQLGEAVALSASLEAGAEQVAEHLRLAHDALGQITGKVTADDLLGEIFATFCIGK